VIKKFHKGFEHACRRQAQILESFFKQDWALALRDFINLLSYKDLLKNLVSRDFKTRYKRSYLGIFWSLLNPLLIIIVYTLAFDYIMKIRVKNFPMFFMCGFLPWSYLSASLTTSMTSLSDSGYLIKAVYFPREILPLSIVLSCLLHFLITFIFVFPILMIYGYFPQWVTLSLLLIILLQSIFIFGLCLFLSSIHVFFRDIRYILDVILTIWFWLTPIVYPISLISEQFLFFYKLNPMTLFVTAYREVLLNNELPIPKYWIAILIATLGSLILGYLSYLKVKKRLAEEI
jgi:ABC-type polysaccharide/polyol phosphate export permease